MNKELVVKTYKIMMIVLVGLIAIAGIAIAVFADNAIGIGSGLTIGVLIGGFLALKFKLPRMFKNNDERTLTIKLVSTVISQTVFALLSYMFFVLTAAGLISFSDAVPYKLLVYVAILITIIFVVDKVSYFLLCKKA